MDSKYIELLKENPITDEVVAEIIEKIAENIAEYEKEEITLFRGK